MTNAPSAHARRILAGDIGGTKTNLALFEVGGDGALRRLRAASYRSAAFHRLSDVIAAFSEGRPLGVAAASFGIAGPVLENRTRMPNCDWELVDGAAVAEQTGIPTATLLNDLVATALGIEALGPDETVALQEGVADPRGPVAVVGAGTGLGMTVLMHTSSGPVVLPSEGGHMDFAPRDDEEIALLRFLMAALGGRVSIERIVSGGGLYNLYAFTSTRVRPDPAVAARIGALSPDRRANEAGQLIGEGALTCPACAEALRLFGSAYGAVAGNLALLAVATGGVFLGGGIAPKNLSLLRDGAFMASFLSKGRYRPILERIPVRVILNQETALLGAAVHARGRTGVLTE